MPEDGVVRLKLTGELDLASVARLKTQLRELAARQAQVRLDLSELAFMDSTGLHALYDAMTDSQRDGWRFEVDPNVSPPVQRLFKLTGFDAFLCAAARNGVGP